MLEPILESEFLDYSYGYQPEKSYHNTLYDIRYRWNVISWVINIDISKYFDKRQHQKLLDLLNLYCDQATVELVGKLIRIGYIDIHNLNDWGKYVEATEGVPQGSLISPIMSNLYLHPLDKFIQRYLQSRYNLGDFKTFNREYTEVSKLTDIEKLFLLEHP